MLNSSVSFLDLSLRLMDVKLVQEPNNLCFLRIRAALAFELQGQKDRAFELYQNCAEDEFAQSRIQVLAPLQTAPQEKTLSLTLKPENENTHFKKALTRDEETVLIALAALKSEKKSITQKKLIKQIKFAPKKIAFLIERLENKGYLFKPQRTYKNIQIIEQPISQNTSKDMSQECCLKEVLENKNISLTFSSKELPLIVQVDSSKKLETTEGLVESIRPKQACNNS